MCAHMTKNRIHSDEVRRIIYRQTMEEGQQPSKVSKNLGIPGTTVARMRKQFKDRGAYFEIEHKGGRKLLLDKDVLEQLARYLVVNPGCTMKELSDNYSRWSAIPSLMRACMHCTLPLIVWVFVYLCLGLGFQDGRSPPPH
jgi:transposase-like protein